MYVCMHACKYVSKCVSKYVSLQVWKYVCMYVCKYVCMYVRMYVCLPFSRCSSLHCGVKATMTSWRNDRVSDSASGQHFKVIKLAGFLVTGVSENKGYTSQWQLNSGK